MGIPLQTIEYKDNGGGLNTKFSPTKVPEDEASLSLNVKYSVDGAFGTRDGSTILNTTAGIPAQMSGAPKTLSLFNYSNSTGVNVQVITAGTAIKHSLSSPTNIVTGLSATLPHPDCETFVTNDDEYMIWGNGVDSNLKFNGTNYTNLSLPIPPPVTLNALAAGILPPGNYDYYVSFARTSLGVIVQESELSPLATITIPAGPNQQITLNVPICTETILPGVVAQCNARVIYRKNNISGDIVRLTSGATILDNTTLTFTDNIPNASLSSVFANFNNSTTPKSKVFEEYLGRLIVVDAANPTDVYYSPVGQPWNVVLDPILFDGPVRCIKRIFGATIFGTDRSIWVLNGDIATNSPRRVSSAIGILNNRCAVGQDSGVLYILSTNYKVYALTATDFSQDQIRLSNPLSLKVDPIFEQINAVYPEEPCMESFTPPASSEVVISVPVGMATNNVLLVYNEAQSILKAKPVWQIYNNINASALRHMPISNEIALASGDYNGFLWRLEDPSKNGDGAEENGVATSATATTLTDLTQSWVPNSLVGTNVRIIDGIGVNQVRLITSNTSDTLTVATAFSVNPDFTSEYTVGGYDAYHFSNWKYVISSYDFLKQLWFIWVNANASGSYEIKLILQFDFDQSATNQVELPLQLSANNSIWGSFIWGAAIWGALAVFQDRVRQYARFRAIRVGFLNRKAGQPFQINTFSISAQDKKLFFPLREVA